MLTKSLFVLFLAVFSIVLSIYGLYLAFSASFFLGVIALIVEPSPLILGLLALFGHSDICERIAAGIGLS